MNFDAFHNIAISQKNLLLDHCRSAERNVRIEPYNSIASARSALDLLCIQLLISKNLYKKQDLFTMIGVCKEHGLFASEGDAHSIRMNGNRFIHTKDATTNTEVPLDECLHTVSIENVKLAGDVVRSLYKVMSEAFGIGTAFDEQKIPFGEYEILRPVKKDPKDHTVGPYHYFVENAAGDCYFVQILPRNETDAMRDALGGRSRDAAAIIREDREPRAFLKNARVLFDHCADSEMEYVAYRAHRDSFMLSELNKSRHVRPTPAQALQIALDLLDELIEMMDLENGLHHRNISPSCVMLTPSKGKYRASLVNFQTVKINNYFITIKPYLHLLFGTNNFIHPNLRNADLRLFDGYWDKADAYSVAAILVFCLDPKAVRQTVRIDDIEDHFSDQTLACLEQIFESSLGAGCSLTEFRRVLKHEIDQHLQ